mmetsp:Transcript_1627/g.2153  ORF Transcript_1627/g.2153 Transcript_1627/m.2153 type:complete len:588 (+) Transcript_1627:166-1929(+)
MKVKLTIGADKLKKSFRLKLNTFIVLTHLDHGCDEEATDLGKTETIQNTKSPRWLRYFEIKYELGEEFWFVATIYNDDGKEIKALGSSKFELSEILGKKYNRVVRLLNGDASDGYIIASVEQYETPTSNKSISLKLRGDFIKKARGFFELERRVYCKEGCFWQPIYRSEFDENHVKQMNWKTCEISYHEFISNENEFITNEMYIREGESKLRITVRDHSKKKGNHAIIGYAETTIDGLFISYKRQGMFPLHKNRESEDIGEIRIASIAMIGHNDEPFNESYQPSTVSSSSINFDTTSESGSVIPTSIPTPIPVPAPEATFVNYVIGGCTLNLCVAIDFTASNGDPRVEGTPHYLNPDNNQLNDYELAIDSIGSMVAKYDTDQNFPVWGFGCKFENVVRHVFQVGNKAEVQGIDGIKNAYRGMFRSGLIMSRPTVFTDVINTAAAQARHKTANGEQAYTLLLILTHGSDYDVRATIEVLKRISNDPLSIIIVGIGNNDFSAMRFLDEFYKNEGCRDICTFVEFEAYRRDESLIRNATLRDIPAQLVSYFQQRGIMPNATVQSSFIGSEEIGSRLGSSLRHSFDSSQFD